MELQCVCGSFLMNCVFSVGIAQVSLLLLVKCLEASKGHVTAVQAGMGTWQDS